MTLLYIQLRLNPWNCPRIYNSRIAKHFSWASTHPSPLWKKRHFCTSVLAPMGYNRYGQIRYVFVVPQYFPICLAFQLKFTVVVLSISVFSSRQPWCQSSIWVEALELTLKNNYLSEFWSKKNTKLENIGKLKLCEVLRILLKMKWFCCTLCRICHTKWSFHHRLQ